MQIINGLFKNLDGNLPNFFTEMCDGGAAPASSPTTTSSDSIARTPTKSSKKMRKRSMGKMKSTKLTENSTPFDTNHVATVLSKLSAASVASTDTEVKDFGFEDSDGNVIKVSVDATQAEEFKVMLSKMLQDFTENDKDIEVAEVLFNLRNKFNIVDVVWPKVVEDEEPVNIGGDDQATDISAEQDPSTEPTTEAPPADSNSAVTSAMDSMLNALIADAEARRQEAVARAAEARAKEASAAAEMSAQKMNAEEEVADMEAFYNSQNEEQKEAKKLAKLAKYRHQMRKSQQQMKSTAYVDALDAQDDDDFANIDTGEDLGNDDPSTLSNNGKGDPDSINNDPTADLDSEMKKPNENEESTAPSHLNFLQALMAMQKHGVRK